MAVEEPLVDLAAIPGLRIDERMAEPTGRFRFVREGLANRLAEAAAKLPAGLIFLVVEGYRSPALQRQLFEEHLEELRDIHEPMPEEELLRLASRFVAPPTGIPPHCSGAAVDLTLAQDGGPELAMGTAVNEGPEASSQRCYSASLDIPEHCRRNREILFGVLRAEGLVNYPTEWWHWSWGDRYWALQTGSPAAVYDLAEGFWEVEA
ncbi:MAG: M15 family metallopeptidase [Actinomycetota bacterium]|nr:M15 family metallopeptidase [Actinomycetota bacterium]